jgi:SAM-dependent methyltransferase
MIPENIPKALERNISAFDADTRRYGGYAYTSIERWSARVATARQSDELHRMLLSHFPAEALHVTDIGCGDGTFTVEIARVVGPASIHGIDPASAAVDAARRRPVPAEIARRLSFEVGNIYEIKNRNRDFNVPSVAVVRGVLHHLDNPRAAIARLADEFRSVIALEPNGYNPVMKAIEKLSSYHREHDEKSYWPPSLNHWFRESGFSVVEQRFFCLVPYFCPTAAAQLLKKAEPLVESIPVIRHIACGTNLVLYKRL